MSLTCSNGCHKLLHVQFAIAKLLVTHGLASEPCSAAVELQVDMNIQSVKVTG
jgi:hypothetical protein